MKSPDETVKAPRTPAPAIYEFAGFRLDPARRALERDGAPVALYPRAFDALELLVQHRHSLLTKELLLQQLWPGTVVEENSLARVISDLRKALGDAATCIVTVARRGYRFEADVRTTRAEPDGERALSRKTLAVLPFTAVGGDTGPLLSFGLADALITRLSRIDDILVRPTSSVARYAEDAVSPSQAGRELKAEVILCGSVRRWESHVRVTAQLIDVSAEATLWAGQFDEASADIFAIEDSIGARVADALALALTRNERRSLSQRYTSNAAAYEQYLHGRFWLSRRTGVSIRNAVRCFEEAARLDANFALAHIGLAEAYSALASPSATLDRAPPTEVVPLARAAALRALAIDDTLGDAHAALGYIALHYEWNWAAAEAAFQRALRLAPSSHAAHQSYAFCLSSVGRTVEALREIKLAREIEPTSLTIRLTIGFMLYRERRYGEAIEELKRCVELEPESVYARFRYALALQEAGRHGDALSQFDAMLGIHGGAAHALIGKAHLLAVTARQQEAREILSRLHALAREHYVSAYFFAEIHAGLGEPDEALRCLNRAYDERAGTMISLQTNPKFDCLRDRAEFQALVRRVGLWS
jgi:TolB-like protein/thioredoxin-like negative regulator of GroEL